MVSHEELRLALEEACAEHEEYKANYREGKFDDYWVGWYVAFLIGKLGAFLPPSQLGALLEEAYENTWESGSGEWAGGYADHILSALESNA